MKAKLFLMNDDYQHVVYARTREEAEEHFKSTFGDEEFEPSKYRVNREIDPNERAIFEDVGEATYGEYVADIPEEVIPTIVCWKEC